MNMNMNTIKWSRRIHCKYGTLKVPFTLSTATEAETLRQQIAKAVAPKGYEVATVKLCTPHSGWAHLILTSKAA